MTLTQRRDAFLRECERLAQLQWRAIPIEASYEDLKSPYAESEIPSTAHPNAIVGSLDAIEARWNIPFLYTHPDCARWQRSGRRAGFPRISPIGGWSNKAWGGCCRKTIYEEQSEGHIAAKTRSALYEESQPL